MSYCRWSSDDFGSDLYIYKSTEGQYVIHVAGNRIVFHQPLPEPVELGPVTFAEWAGRHQTIMKMIDDPSLSHREHIGLPHDGEAFTFDTAGECAEQVLELIAMGYHCPDGVVEELQADEVRTD